MKHKIKHIKVDQNTAETVARLIQIIDRELARGEDADEALILECTEYLQELSPETAVPAKVTEKYLQAELNRPNGGMHITHRRSHRRILKVALRLAAVIVALAIFCVAIPVAAVHLSVDGTVGEELEEYIVTYSGEYQWMVDKGIAVMGPLAVTAACLFLMFLSRRVVYPWLISIFSLALPLLIYITNIFPA